MAKPQSNGTALSSDEATAYQKVSSTYLDVISAQSLTSGFNAAISASEYDYSQFTQRAYAEATGRAIAIEKLRSASADWDALVKKIDVIRGVSSLDDELETLSSIASSLSGPFPDAGRAVSGAATLWGMAGTGIASVIADMHVDSTTSTISLLGDVLSTDLTGSMHAMLDGTPAAAAFGVMDSLLKAGTGETLEQWIASAFSALMGDAVSAVPVVGWAAKIILAGYSMANELTDATTKRVMNSASDYANLLNTQTQSLIGQRPRVAQGASPLTRPFQLTRGQAGSFGRMEGTAFWRTDTGRVVRSIMLNHLYKKPHIREEFGVSTDTSAQNVWNSYIKLAMSKDYADMRQAREDVRSTLSAAGITSAISFQGTSLWRALDGERIAAQAALLCFRDMVRRGLVPVEEVFIVSKHYTASAVQAWDGAGESTGAQFQLSSGAFDPSIGNPRECWFCAHAMNLATSVMEMAR